MTMGKNLRKLYDYLNVVAFEGRLKKIPVIYGRLAKEWEAIAVYQYSIDTGKSWRIIVDSRAKRVIPPHFLLLHEMTHQWEHEVCGYTRTGDIIHNKRFKRKLKQLHKRLGWKLPPSWSLRR